MQIKTARAADEPTREDVYSRARAHDPIAQDRVFRWACDGGDRAAQDLLIELAAEHDDAARSYLAAWSLPIFREIARQLVGRNGTPSFAASDLAATGLRHMLETLDDLRVRNAAGFVSLAHKILANRNRDHWRRRNARPSDDGSQRVDELPAPDRPAEDEARLSELWSTLLRSIDDPIDREIAWQRGYVGRTFREIGERMDPAMTEDSVRMRWNRMLPRLRRLLGGLT